MTALHRTDPVPFLFLALACALPLGSSGCSQRACFFWTEAEGACPAQAEAINFFTNTSCDSPIESVDSEAEFDGELCCYDVTERSMDDALCTSPPPTPDPGGPGGGSMPSCQTCGLVVSNVFMGFPADSLCATSVAVLNTLLDCVCAGPCQTLCSDNVCVNGSSTSCFDCATDSAVGCGSQFSACVNDL